ncbi:MAG: fibronectin type III domain-containing protein [Bacteroidales bacterium]|nr:fibronectin type III domain-containing protein [Bacteroidales bacterium]
MMKKLFFSVFLLLMMAIGAMAQTTLFSEDFEGGSMPDGWTTDGPGSWSVGSGDYSSTTGAGQGTYNAKITHGSSGSVTKLITPEIDLSSATSVELSFMHVQRSWAGDYDYLKLYYRASSDDSWTEIASYTTAYASWTTEEGIALPNLSSTYQLAFEMTDNYGYGVGVDYVQIATPPTCIKPTSLAASGITSTSATLDWSAGASETAWVLKYGPAGFDVESEGTSQNISTTPTFEITGLAANTAYDVYVKANCGGGDESEWIQTSFRTECGIESIPWSENFDSQSAGAVPTCWTKVGSGSALVNNGNANSGSNSLRFSGVTGGNIIALPQFGSEISGLQLSFYTRPENTTNSSCGTFEVGYITDLTDASTFVPVESYAYNDWASATHTQKDVVMSSAPAGSYFAFNHKANATYYYWFVDDVSVDLAPSCVKPISLAVSNITSHTATLTWTAGADETAWQISLNGDEDDLINVTEPTYTLTGLAPESDYTVKVRANCGDTDGNSQWTSAVQFTTPCEAISSLPYEQGFESSGVPSCWTKVGSGTATGYSYASQANTGSYFLRFSGTTSNNIIAMPQFDESLSSLVLDFYTRPESNTNSSCGTFEVGYITDLTDVATFVALDTYSYDDWASANYEEKTVNMTSVPAGSYMAFNHKANSSSWYWFVDDVTVREAFHGAEILTYSLPTQVADATFDSENGTIAVTVAFTTDLNALAPEYTISAGAEISTPVLTVAGDGESCTVEYDVTAEDGTTIKHWTVTVTKAQVSHDAFITAFTFAGQKPETTAVIVSENDTYTVNAVAVWNANLTSIAPVVTISNSATVVPASGIAQDFTTPVTYTVTAEDGTTINAYTVTIVNDPDACINPATVNVTDITTTTATLGWAQAYTETSYLVKVSTIAMTDMTATADVFDGTVDATTKALEGLAANTEYYVYVQSSCDNAEGWTLSSFTTLCEAVAEFPWTENFNSLTSGIPSCWDNSEGTTTTDSYKWNYYATGHEGACVRFNSYNNSSYNTNMLKTVSLDLAELTSAKLEFWYKNPTGGDFSVYVSTDGGATYTDNVIATGLTDVSDWTNAAYDISSYCGNSNVVIVFKGTSNWGYGDAYIYLDDVTVREPYSSAEIVDFNFPTRMADPVINSENATVTAIASYQADFATLAEEVTISEGAAIVETDATVNENVKTFEYTVTAENGTTKDWTVTVTKAESASTANDIVAFSFVGQVGESAIDPEAKTVTAYAEWDFDFENNTIAPTIEVSPMATINPLSGDAQNFSTPIQYAVTAEDGESVANWTVTITNDPNVCINPAEIALDAATATTATLKWEKAYLETSYLVKVSTTEMDDMDAEADVYDGEVTLTGDEATLELTGLTPATFYYIYVQSNCGADGWTDGLFGTECDGSAYSVPFVETFETGSALCWTIIDANEDADENGYGAWHFDGEGAYYLYNTTNAANDWLISPKISIVDGSYLTFDYAVDYYYYPEKFSVYVMTDIADYATATVIRETATVSNEEYASIENIDLSAYAGQDIYIGIKCESDANQDALLIDNFKVTLPTYTITATAGENGTIDPASAEVMLGYDKDITITPAEGYEIASVIVDADTEDEEDVSEELTYDDGVFTYTFENVTANHTIHATFRELQTYTITVNITGNGTVVAIDDDENEIPAENGVITVNHYDDVYLVITPAEHNEISSVYVNGSEMDLIATGDTLPLLAVEENYTVNVTFVPEMAVDMIEAGSMAVYPNPNNGMFSIDFSNIEGDATYEIIDVRGAVVETRSINVMNGATMNFNHNLDAGTYFVRIISGDKVYVEQIVVE